MRERLLWVAWPSFLMAGLLEMLVFSAADPAELHGLGDWPARLGELGVYTLAFAAFWAACALGCSLTLWLASPVEARRKAPIGGRRKRLRP